MNTDWVCGSCKEMKSLFQTCKEWFAKISFTFRNEVTFCYNVYVS